jgi:tRNA pseudouridine55 synthase
MDGILIIDKPVGITSHDVVSRVRRILKTKRVGHTGTLDPFATGVMVILVGQATRLAQFLDKDSKEYVAGVQLGFETDTGDLTGERRLIEFTRKPEELDEQQIRASLEEFLGEQDQTPPMYSAKKIDGKKLYEHARAGREVERKPVRITIQELELIDRTTPDRLDLRILCSAGTYIRTLAEDLGKRLDVGAHLVSLRRTRAGKFDIASAVTLDELASLDDPAARLVRLETAVEHLPEISLNDDRAQKTRQGLPTRTPAPYTENAYVRMLDSKGSLIAIGQFDKVEAAVRPKIVLV